MKRFQLIEKLTSEEFGAETMRNITDDQTQSIDYYNPMFDAESDAGTAHLSVLAPDGGAVSITSTINLWYRNNASSSSGWM